MDRLIAQSKAARDAEKGLAATPDSLYSIGSVTKSFTTLAIMQLAEQGKLSVDDPIEKYMPFDIHPGGETVRIWHLMSHSSGLPALAYAENSISAGRLVLMPRLLVSA